ncbi:AAA family ATPase [bacterium]|nr:AAA family ATPase [bacterium]
MRYLISNILSDLKKKMVFIGGPRQVGKTTLACAIMDQNFQNGRYLNWDFDEHRQDILNKKWSHTNDLLVFDELHKYPHWKQWIKGVYDIYGKDHSYLLTGSARLDVYRQGGDSLMGRYHYWRLHPFTLDEIPKGISRKDAMKRLMTVGGFPEPFLDGDEREGRRWRRERFNLVLREDIRDLESVRNIQLLGVFLDMLRARTGGLITISNIAADLQISPKTAKSWLEVLARMYLIFIVRPYTKSLPRAILKPPKVYFFDNADTTDAEGARFENLVASSLLKRIHFLQDRDGYQYELKYIRDKEGREVDFAIVKDGILDELIEVKFSDDTISRSLQYYADRLNPRKATQLVMNFRRSYSKGKLEVTDPLTYFCGES